MFLIRNHCSLIIMRTERLHLLMANLKKIFLSSSLGNFDLNKANTFFSRLRPPGWKQTIFSKRDCLIKIILVRRKNELGSEGKIICSEVLLLHRSPLSSCLAQDTKCLCALFHEAVFYSKYNTASAIITWYPQLATKQILIKKLHSSR